MPFMQASTYAHFINLVMCLTFLRVQHLDKLDRRQTDPNSTIFELCEKIESKTNPIPCWLDYIIFNIKYIYPNTNHNRYIYKLIPIMSETYYAIK